MRALESPGVAMSSNGMLDAPSGAAALGSSRTYQSTGLRTCSTA